MKDGYDMWIVNETIYKFVLLIKDRETIGPVVKYGVALYFLYIEVYNSC